MLMLVVGLNCWPGIGLLLPHGLGALGKVWVRLCVWVGGSEPPDKGRQCIQVPQHVDEMSGKLLLPRVQGPS